MGLTTRLLTGTEQRSTMEQYLIDRHAGAMSAGVDVTNRSVTGIPAFIYGAELAAEAVAQLGTGVWRGRPVRRRVEDTWLARLFRVSPNPQQDEFSFWHTIQASLEYRGNAYVWLSRAGREIAHRTALHPDQVNPYASFARAPVTYQVTFSPLYPAPPEAEGYGTAAVDGETILHIRGRGGVGELVAPSPVKLYRTALGLALAKQAHESSLFARGAGHGIVARFPAGVTKKAAEEWRDVFDSQYAGPLNARRTKAIGNGAEITTISMTQEDAQFIESVNASLRDVAFMLGIPPWLLVPDKMSKPLSPEHEMQRWLYQGLGPRLARIESAINAHPRLFAKGTDFFSFDTTDFIRGDLDTEDRIAHQQVQDGRLLVDEWRVAHGRQPLPDGVGMIPQITPVGGAPNAAPTAQPADDGDDTPA